MFDEFSFALGKSALTGGRGQQISGFIEEPGRTDFAQISVFTSSAPGQILVAKLAKPPQTGAVFPYFTKRLRAAVAEHIVIAAVAGVVIAVGIQFYLRNPGFTDIIILSSSMIYTSITKSNS